MESNTPKHLIASCENKAMNDSLSVSREAHSRRLGFTSLEDEVTDNHLSVMGEIPPWLTGTLVRNGPAKFEVGNQNYRHWFDGLGMLHRFSFKNGQVSYTNRFLQSNAYKEAMETGKISYREFATDPCRSIFGRVQSIFFSDNANVNITQIGHRFIAMTETPLPIEFDPRTLKTVGVLEPSEDDRVAHTTAHPHYDFARMQSVSYATRFSQNNTYNVYGTSSITEKKLIGSIQVDEPGYMHSFGMTENYIILAEFPLVVQPADFLVRTKPFIENYRWKPERGSRFIVMNKAAGGVTGIYTTDPFFAFHHVNAFESSSNEIILDIIAYNDSSIIRSLYLDVLRGDSHGTVSPSAELRRYHIPLQTNNDVYYEIVANDSMELPRINYRQYNTKDYRFVYAVGQTYDFAGLRNWPLVKVDISERRSKVWSENDYYPGEPVFVPRPDGIAEDDGIILSVVLDSKKGNSFLLILDAKSFEEIARAEAPHHIPFGFHGEYFDEIRRVADAV
jgi:beta,beta-carotene 9',10'-dioxygenase